MIQINPGLIQLFVAIEALLVIIYGVIKGGIDVRRMVFAGSAVIFAYALPFILSHLIPGFGDIATYQLLQKYAEGAENTWGFVYQLSSKVMLIDAGAMTALNTIELISSFGLASIPQQYEVVLMNLGWTLDPIDAIVESINHASQVLVAIFHTIAWLAWFSWAIAPAILGIALALLIPERTRPMGTAVLLLTLAIMFFTALVAHTLGLSKEAQLINTINNTLATIEHDLPANVTVRGYLLLQSNYPYLVTGQLINETTVCGSRTCYYEPSVVSWFMGITPSVGIIDQFAYPQINNVTLLWLSVNPNYQCNLLIWPPSRNLTQGPVLEQCNPQLFDNNETFAEEITIEGSPFNLITESINGTTVYSGAWKWINPPTSYTVSNGNNTVVINATINIPPMQCINITNPRTGISQRICHSSVTADLWLWASSISYPSQLNGTNWSCKLSLANSSRYPIVDLTQEFNTIKTFMNKLINESEISRKLIYPNMSIPTYALPSPTPNGYRQMELSINCINWNNYSVVVPLTIMIYGVGNNPWFASVPFLISPSDEWIINSSIVGDESLIINWWDVNVKRLLGFLGVPIAQWLAEIAVIYGLLDGVAWFFGLPTILSPVYSIMQGVIMELSLVLYLQIRAIGRLMQRAIRKITKSIGTRLQGSYQALSTKHPRLAKALGAPAKAVGEFRRTVVGGLRHRFTTRLIKEYTATPRAARTVRVAMNPWYGGLTELEQYHRKRAQEHESMDLKRKAQLHRFLASSTRFVRDYGRVRSLAERGLLFQYTRSGLSRLNKPIEARHLETTKVGGLTIYKPLHQAVLTERETWVRRVAPVLTRYVKPDWTEVFTKYENTEFGRFIRRLYEVGERGKASALVLAKELGLRYIRPIKTKILLVGENVNEVRGALARGNFTVKHVGDKTIVHLNDAKLTHILESLKQFSGYGSDVDEALGKAIERVTAIVRANIARETLKNEFVSEVTNRLKPVRDFVEAAGKGVFINLNHPIIQRFIDFLGPEGERVIREAFNAKGMIDRDAANEVINRLKPIIQRRVSEEVEAARYLIAVKHHADEVMREFTRELGIERRLGELEGKLRELEEFARKAIASEFPMPKDRITRPELFGNYEVVGGRMIVREPFSRELRLDWQLPKEVLNDEGLSKTTTLWVVHHYADRLYNWLTDKPGDAILHNSIYTGWIPGALVLSALYGLGIDPGRLNWEGLLDELERLDEGISRVKAELKEARDDATKAKLKEELNKLKGEREGLLKALITWANAIETLKLALPREEWEGIYEKLPKRLKDLVDVARDPRDSFEAFLKKDCLKMLAILDREGRRAGKHLSVDEIREAMELLRNHLPMLDRLIEPVRAELIDALTNEVNYLLNELGGGSLTSTRLSALSARNMLELAKKELEGGDLNNAINHLWRAINDLREVVKEREELARDVGRLDELTKQLNALRALGRLVKQT
jgi:hypothetical protein